MANTTFNGPVRSEKGFIDIAKDSLGNVITNMKLEQYTATVTVDNGATTGKESAIGMPTNFIPLACAVVVTVAATNAVNLDDVGSDADYRRLLRWNRKYMCSKFYRVQRILGFKWCIRIH